MSNRFDLVRLILASLVFFYHAVALSAPPQGGVFEAELARLGELSIQGFFIVSGALVLGSYERSNSVKDYFGKRFRRLYPAYAMIILVPALIVAIITLGDRQSAVDVMQYLGANLLFLNFLAPNLPGLFEGHRFTEVNGALWTLKIEVMFYMILPILAWGLARLQRFWWIGIGVLVVAAFAWKHTMLALDHPLSPQLSRQLPGQMMFFAAGMALWRMWPVARRHSWLLFLIGLLTLAMVWRVPAADPLRVLGLTCLIAGVATVPGPPLNPARWGDISYGVYIVHFPIVQMLIGFGVFAQFGLMGGLVAATSLVLCASYLLWWWVERPALRRDSHYRRASTERAIE